MRELAWRDGDGVRSAHDGAAAWFRGVQLAQVGGEFMLRTPKTDETALLILGGTFDLAAGAGSWAQRGLRTTPFDGRPCALYLPPDTALRATGRGELLLVGCRRPPPPPRESQSPPMRPLLELSGSGKAYDSRTGTWELLERFPAAPEAVLPRAIARVEVDGTVVERVFAAAFKALALRLDEGVVGAGRSFEPRPDAAAIPADGELAILVRAPGGAEVRVDDTMHPVLGDAVFCTSAPEGLRVTAGRLPTYVVCAWAWPKV